MATSPTIDAIRAAIKAELDAIAGPALGAGKVHDRARHTVEETDVETDFMDTDGVLRATWIEIGPERSFEDVARYKYWQIWKCRVRHIRHFDDNIGSDKLFATEIEKIKARLRAKSTVFGIPEMDTQRETVTEVWDMRFFTTRMVHHATLAFEVESSEVIAP